MALANLVWSYFEEIEDEDKFYSGCYQTCKKLFKCTSSSTSSLRTHFCAFHSKWHAEIERAENDAKKRKSGEVCNYIVLLLSIKLPK